MKNSDCGNGLMGSTLSQCYMTTDNKIYKPTTSNVTECGMSSLREWQQPGHDKGTIAGTFTDDHGLVAMVKSLLLYS